VSPPYSTYFGQHAQARPSDDAASFRMGPVIWASAARPKPRRLLLLRFCRFRSLASYERFDTGEFLFESRHEIARSVFEQHHEAKREKQEQDDPEDRS
jgi:hypothetical protein